MLIYRKFLLMAVAAVMPLLCRGELAGDPNDPDFVHATMMVASPGPAVYQVGGHTFIRMECKAADLDVCFTFENENAGDFGQLFRVVNGRFICVPAPQYMQEFVDDGRTLVSLPLNLEPLQKQRLWQVLDSLTMTGMHPFNIRKESCSGHILQAIDIALRPASIQTIGSPIIGRCNGDVVRYAVGGEGPWRTFIILVTMGMESDIADNIYNQAPPILLSSEWRDFYIVNRDGTAKPLFLAPDVELLPKQEADARGLTPTVVGWIGLALSCLMLLIGYLTRSGVWTKALRVLYCVIIMVGWVLLTTILALPSAIGGWDNLNFLFLNPLPLLLLLLKGRRQVVATRWVMALWLVYAIAGPMITTSIPVAMSMYAVAAALAWLPVAIGREIFRH